MGNANNATVVTPDVPVCNSVVHVVDRVLLPNATLIYIPTYSNESMNTLSIEKISKNLSLLYWLKENVPCGVKLDLLCMCHMIRHSVTRLYFTYLYSLFVKLLLPETT